MQQSLIDLITSRVSFPRLAEPAPSSEQLERIYRSALRAPDHMMLRPWRYLVIQGDNRNRLGEVFCQAAVQDDDSLSQAQRDKFNAMPLRAPLIIVGISTNVDHPKVPVEEQEISCGVGIGYMLLALQAEGFGGIWRTGPMASHDFVRQSLGLAEHESLIGFLYVGTPQGDAKPIPHIPLERHFSEWSPN